MQVKGKAQCLVWKMGFQASTNHEEFVPHQKEIRSSSAGCCGWYLNAEVKWLILQDFHLMVEGKMV